LLYLLKINKIISHTSYQTPFLNGFRRCAFDKAFLQGKSREKRPAENRKDLPLDNARFAPGNKKKRQGTMGVKNIKTVKNILAGLLK